MANLGAITGWEDGLAPAGRLLAELQAGPDRDNKDQRAQAHLPNLSSLRVDLAA